jgi:hypothetical protein
MSVVYALVSQEPDIIVSDYSEAIGNFRTFATLLLPKLEKKENKAWDIDIPGNYGFHYVRISGFGFMCMNEKNKTKSKASKFLRNLSTNFLTAFYEAGSPRGQNEVWQFGVDFKKTIKDLMVAHDKALQTNPDWGNIMSGYADEELN